MPSPRNPRAARPPLTPAARRWRIALAVVTVLAWAPLASALIAAAVANAAGCALDEAAANPCLVAGMDIGELLTGMFLMAWIAIFALPIMVATAIGWLLLLARRRPPA